MGIIKNRDEYLPVTCAVLKEADRSAFFKAIQSKHGGKPDQLAKLLNVPVSVVHDWISGQLNIPYNLLQHLAHEFGMELPPIGELRRESQLVVSLASPSRPHAASPPATRERPAKRERKPREPKPSRRMEKPQRQASPKQPPRERAPRQSPPQQQGPKPGQMPKLSDKLAYWVGTCLGAAKRQEDSIVFVADRRMGQNFADVWARHTKSLFNAMPHVAMKENGLIREAAFPTAGLEQSMGRLGLVVGERGQAHAIPRWVWSNPEWKAFCVKGIADTCARFQRTPALAFAGLPAPLAHAVVKVLTVLGFRPQAKPDGSILLSGRDEVEKYLQSIGTDNLKLRDQLQAYFRRQASPAQAMVQAQSQESVPEETISQEDVPAETPAPAMDQPGPAPDPPPKPQAPKRPASRRTLYRGRPKR